MKLIKVALLSRRTKKAMIISFVIISISKRRKNEIFCQITVNTNEIYQLDFLEVCFKLLYEKSNDCQILS